MGHHQRSICDSYCRRHFGGKVHMSRTVDQIDQKRISTYQKVRNTIKSRILRRLKLRLDPNLPRSGLLNNKEMELDFIVIPRCASSFRLSMYLILPASRCEITPLETIKQSHKV